MNNSINKQILLKSRPVGEPKESDFALAETPIPEPGEGEVRIKVEAIGLNRAEVLFHEGRYLEKPRLPSKIGFEAAGTIDALGPGGVLFLSGFIVADRHLMEQRAQEVGFELVERMNEGDWALLGCRKKS